MSNIYSDSSSISDYLEGLSMEIGAEFFPLPVSVVRTDEIHFPLQVMDDSYDFVAEQVAVDAYAKNEETKKQSAVIVATRLEQQQKPPSGLVASEGDSKGPSSARSLEEGPYATPLNGVTVTQSGYSVVPKCPSNPPMLFLPATSEVGGVVSQGEQNVSSVAHSAPEWSSSRVSSGGPKFMPSCSEGILQPQPFVGHQRRPSAEKAKDSNHYQRLFADFESSSSPFDTLEIKTIDDRAMLQQVLDSRW